MRVWEPANDNIRFNRDRTMSDPRQSLPESSPEVNDEAMKLIDQYLRYQSEMARIRADLHGIQDKLASLAEEKERE
jgi:hypothetical protein